MKALLSHDQTAIWPRLCLRGDFWPTKKVGICCPNATVSGNIIINQLKIFQKNYFGKGAPATPKYALEHFFNRR